MKPIIHDEKQVVLGRLIADLGRLRTDAGNLSLDMLAFLIAQAQDEAQDQLEQLQSEGWPASE